MAMLAKRKLDLGERAGPPYVRPSAGLVDNRSENARHPKIVSYPKSGSLEASRVRESYASDHRVGGHP
jgi:hypothetical protein